MDIDAIKNRAQIFALDIGELSSKVYLRLTFRTKQNYQPDRQVPYDGIFIDILDLPLSRILEEDHNVLRNAKPLTASFEFVDRIQLSGKNKWTFICDDNYKNYEKYWPEKFEPKIYFNDLDANLSDAFCTLEYDSPDFRNITCEYKYVKHLRIRAPHTRNSLNIAIPFLMSKRNQLESYTDYFKNANTLDKAFIARMNVLEFYTDVEEIKWNLAAIYINMS